MRAVVSVICILLLLAIPGQGAKTTNEATLRRKVSSLSAGTRVAVTLQNNQKLSGRLGEITESGFELKPLKGDNAPTAIAWSDTRKVEDQSRFTKGSLIFIGALTGLLVVLWAWANSVHA